MEWIAVYGLVFARLATFMAMLPMLGESEFMPRMAKGVLLVVLMPFMIPYEMASAIHLKADLNYILLFIKECSIGALLGFLVGLPLRIPEMMGDLIDQQRGATVTDKFNPLTGQESSYLGQLLMFTLMAYFMTEGGLKSLVSIISGSFMLQGPASWEFGFGIGLKEVYLTIFSDFMRLFAILSMPVVVAMLMGELALGLASRSAPSINAFQLAQPVKAAIAIGVCILLQPRIVTGIMSWFDTFTKELGA